MLVLSRIILLIGCCTTLALGKCEIEKAKKILKDLKEMTKVAPKFEDDGMKLLSKNLFNLNVLTCPINEAKPLYAQHEKVFKEVLQHYESECPNFSNQMKEIKSCHAKLVPTKLFTSGVAEFCREYDHCLRIYNNSCLGLRNISMGNTLSDAAVELCKIECKTKDLLVKHLSNCWGYVNLNTNVKSKAAKSRKYNDLYQCISSLKKKNCSLTPSQTSKILPLYSHDTPSEIDQDNGMPKPHDCVNNWRSFEGLKSWSEEICKQVIHSKDCIIERLKDEKKKIMNAIQCKCYPPNKNFHKFDIMDSDNKITRISSSSHGVFDGKMVSRLYSVTLLLVTRFTIQL